MRYWIILGLLCHSVTFALTETLVSKAGAVQFEVIQNGLTINHNSLSKAKLINLKNGGVGIELELKADDADALKQLTYENIGKQALIIFNDRVVSRSTIAGTLGSKILITGFTRPEALLFLQTLRYEEKQQKKPKSAPTLLDKINDNQPALIQRGSTVQ